MGGAGGGQDVREDECLLGQGTGNSAACWALIKLFARPVSPSFPTQRFSLCQTLQANPFARVGQVGLSYTTPRGFLPPLAGTELGSGSVWQKSQEQPDDDELMASLQTSRCP